MGRLLALLYLLCVLAPGAALAFGSGPTPCFDEPIALAHVHDGVAAAHDHASAHHHHGGSEDNHSAGDAGHDQHGKGGPAACCAMLCVSAIPTSLPYVVMPDQPVSTCASVVAQILHDEAPALLYRPPIS